MRMSEGKATTCSNNVNNIYITGEYHILCGVKPSISHSWSGIYEVGMKYTNTHDEILYNIPKVVPFYIEIVVNGKWFAQNLIIPWSHPQTIFHHPCDPSLHPLIRAMRTFSPSPQTDKTNGGRQRKYFGLKIRDISIKIRDWTDIRPKFGGQKWPT